MLKALHHYVKKHAFYTGLYLTLLTWGGYFVYIWPKMFFRDMNGLTAGWIGIWGDWAAHLSYASVFAYRPMESWFLSHPLYFGRKFTYPFVADALSGLLIRAGIDVVPAFIVPSILLSLLLLFALYRFYFALLRSAKQAYLALTLFLAGGGVGFWWFVKDLVSTRSLDTLLFPPKEYTHLGDTGIEWINIVAGQLITQRALLLGMPIVIGYLVYLSSQSKRDFTGVSHVTLVILGLLSGLMLTVHIHSYIALALICAIFLAMRPKQWKYWLTFGLGAAISSLLIYQWLYGNQLDPGFFRWFPGWLAREKNMNFWLFWWLNWGFFLPVAFLGAWKSKLYKEPLIIGSVIIFILANLFLFQPFAWDNTKLLDWTYLILAAPAAAFLAVLWQQKNIGKVVALVLFFTLTASSFIDLWRLTHTQRQSNQLVSNEDLALAAEFREVSAPTDRVLIAPQHNHWIATLTGRPILLGFKGWMWTYGIDYGQTDSDISTMYAGTDESQSLLSKYDIAFVVIGPTELAEYQANEGFFATHYPKVLENNTFRIYKVK